MATIKTQKQLKAMIREMIVQESGVKPKTIQDAIKSVEEMDDRLVELIAEIGQLGESVDKVLDDYDYRASRAGTIYKLFSECFRPYNEMRKTLAEIRKHLKAIE